MAKILSVVGRAGLARVLDPVARTALRAGVTPNAVTVVGTIGVLVGAVGFGARGYMLIAVVIVALCALTDLVDGAMARARGQVGQFGALLDSTMDRVADGAIFGSLAYWFATTGQHRGWPPRPCCAWFPAWSSRTSRPAPRGWASPATSGLIERAERLILVGVGAVLYTVRCSLWIRDYPVAACCFVAAHDLAADVPRLQV